MTRSQPDHEGVRDGDRGSLPGATLSERLLDEGGVHPLRRALRDYAGIGFIVLFAIWMLAC